MKNIRYFITIIAILLAFSATAACESVERDLPDTASPGDPVTVRLTQEGFLAVVEVAEELPEGFVYMPESYTGSRTPTYHTGNNTLVMMLAGTASNPEITATYTVTAGTFDQIDTAVFKGTYQGFDNTTVTPKDGFVTGDDTLTPEQPTPTPTQAPTPTPTRRSSGGNGGMPLPSQSPAPTATEVNATSTPVETATPVETQAAEETPTVAETPTATPEKTPKPPKGGIPGFEGVYLIGGLMALVLIMRRNRND